MKLQGQEENVYSVLLQGRIRDVDPRKWTVDISMADGGYLEAIPIATPYIHYEEGEGIFALPEIGAHCLVNQSNTGDTPYVMAFLPLRSSTPGKVDSPEDNHSSGRETATPGDIFLQGRDGNFVRVRRGGLIEIGSSDMCQSMYFPIGDLIRSICMNHETHVGGSYFKTNVLDSPDVPDKGPTPVQVDILLQEYVEKAPLIDVKMGHVVDDEKRHLANADPNSIVARLLVFSQDTVDVAEKASLSPSPDQAVVAIRFDRYGNAEEILSGQYLLKAGSRRLYITGSDVVLVAGNRTEQITGNLETRVGGDFLDHTDGRRTISSRGPLVFSGERVIFSERQAREERIEGNHRTEIGGNRVQEMAGDYQVIAGGSSGDTCVGNRSVVTGGKYHHTIIHGSEPGSVLQGALASLLKVVDGTIRQHAIAGDVEFFVGPAVKPYCKVRIHGSPTAPQEFGRVSIEWINPAQKLTIDGLTGAISYTNAAGEWLMDATGRTKLGMRGSPAGNVVTTLTHPFCFMTGAPIPGCASVSAAGPPTILPVALPLVPITPNTPKPDIPRP